ncbi:MAG: methylamine utilization protein MauE [Haliea sp.]|nr:methylamine utilization protein MauE [Haliea sp.]
MTLDGTVRVVLGILLAFIFLRAAWHKVADTRRFIAQLGAYRLLPGPVLPLLAAGFILLEVYLAATLPLPGWRSSALLAAALLGIYALAMGINLARDRRDLDCGCGGPAGDAQAISWALVVRNCFLATLALIAALPVAARTWSALDVGTALLAGIAACLLYSSIEQAIANWQRERRYAAQRTSYSILSPTSSPMSAPTAGPTISSAPGNTSSNRAISP